jgi:glycosyltransferase involved in cell wall biosynthesis
LERRLKLALVSSGLGHTTRGFEVSTARWFNALRKHCAEEMDTRLFCGGPVDGGKALWNFPRQSAWTAPFRFIPFLAEKERWELCYGAEQISFWSALNFELLGWKPDVVWVKDIPLAHFLLLSRSMFGLKYKLILANGGMLRPPTYKDFDVIQQISLQAYEEALDYGITPEKMELISNCFPPFEPLDSRDKVRSSLGFGENDWVVICVAAWNKYHKRIDYLIEEVARLGDPNVKLILCGEPEVDAKELQELGEKLLPDRIKWLTVAPDMVPNLLHASDAFVLPSLRESLGNALVEAALCGVPLVTHPHHGARFAIKDEYWMADLSEPGSLTARLSELKSNPPSLERVKQMKDDVTERFSEGNLAGQFKEMVLNACDR